MIRCTCFFFFNDTATTEIYTLSLHDALPIFERSAQTPHLGPAQDVCKVVRAVQLQCDRGDSPALPERSEEHTSELQSRQYLVCRLLLEKKKITLDAPLTRQSSSTTTTSTLRR